MMNLPIKRIESIIKSCGLAPQKSKNISKLSKIITEAFDSKVPESFIDLENLPGVGHKTASVVMSQGFGHPAFPVDTHIHRLAQRWGLTNGKNVEFVFSVTQTEKDLKKLFQKIAGINYIYRSSIMEELIVQQEDAMVLFVKFVRNVFQTEKNPLKKNITEKANKA